jgi:hypothetical protein
MHLGKTGGQKRADEITHRLSPKLFGERGGPDDVAKQDRNLLYLAGQRSPAARGSRSRSGDKRFPGCAILQTRRAERGAALAAKPIFGRVAKTTGRACPKQWRAARSAKFHAAGIVGATPKAPHAGSPRNTGNRISRAATLVSLRLGGQFAVDGAPSCFFAAFFQRLH